MAGVEELYKQFGILADANEKAGEVNLTIFPIKLNMAPIPSRGSEAKRLSSFYANLIDENFSQLLFLTARGCFFGDFGCCKGITGRKTIGIAIYNEILQVLPQVTRKCY